MTNTVTPTPDNPTVPLDSWGNCLWCGMEPGPDCCQGDHPDRYAAEAEYAAAPVIVLGAPRGTAQPGLTIGRAFYRPRRNTIGGAR